MVYNVTDFPFDGNKDGDDCANVSKMTTGKRRKGEERKEHITDKEMVYKSTSFAFHGNKDVGNCINVCKITTEKRRTGEE